MIDWSSHLGAYKGGRDYRFERKGTFYIYNNILEVPVSIRKIRLGGWNSSRTQFAKNIFYSLWGKKVWLRPSVSTLDEMKKLVNKILKEDEDYIEFMMHSSEFMPNGSPYYRTRKDIDALFFLLDNLFEFISEKYAGYTLTEYRDVFHKI